MVSLTLPRADGSLYTYETRSAPTFEIPKTPFQSRVAFSAVHVVADPLADADPLTSAQIDWESTLAYRRHLWSLGMSVAEAMDTAQRGMGLNWEMAKELIKRSVQEAKAVGGRIACGVGTDHLVPGKNVTIE